MELHVTALEGLWVVKPEKHQDERGFFARTYDREVFEANGFAFEPSQSSISFNHKKFTLRGLHYQAPPEPEVKLVRCSRGAIFDVAVDVRPDSPTYGRWTSARLDDENQLGLFIPEGFAHGFLTLADCCEVAYMISGKYSPSAARGIRWDDPGPAIEWPAPPAVISERDATYADFQW